MEQTAREFPSTFVSALWGMTEGGLTTCLPDSPAGKRLNTCGRGLPGLEISILDGDGRELPLGEEGELSMRGPGVFFGYLAQDDLYQSLMTPSRYFRTGDLARLDDEGYVRITGRIKDLLVRGGVNISPVPIEDAIAAHPDVQAVAVVGYPDERLGDRICAVIAPKEPTPPTLEGLLDFVRAQGLPKRYWPEIIRFRPEFPRTAAGKIRKIELREEVLAADLRANLRRQDQ